MVSLVEFAGATSIVVIFVAASVIKSVKGGYLGNVLDKTINQGEQVNGKLDDIHQLSQETYKSTEENGEYIDDLGEAVYLLHKDEEQVDEQELREKVNVDETGVDIFDGKTD